MGVFLEAGLYNLMEKNKTACECFKCFMCYFCCGFDNMMLLVLAFFRTDFIGNARESASSS